LNEIEIKIPSDPKLLKIIRSGIAHVNEICGFSPEASNAVTIAVDEAVSNIMKHAYRGKKDGTIAVIFRILDDRLEIVLRDFGEKADLDSIKSRDLDEVRPGGLGVHLIKSTMDIVVYDNSPEVGNRLTLAKYLPGKKEKRC